MKFFIFFILFYSIANAEMSQQEIVKQLQSEAALLNQNDSALNDNNQKTSKKTSSKKNNIDTYRDVAIYKLIKQRDEEIDRNSKNHDAKAEEFIANNKDIYEEAEAEFEKTLTEKEKQSEKEIKEKIYNITGYCSTRNPIEVERVQAYSILDCQFNKNDLNIENTQMFASFVPIYDKLALFGRPIYLNVHHNKLPIKNGVMLTVDQTNLNLATFINDVKIKNLLADMALASNSVVYNSSVAYMTALEESKKTEEVNITPNTSGQPIIQTATNTKKPNVDDYVITAGIQLVSSLINAVGNFYKDNNYPLYKIAKRTQLYVDFNIKIKGDAQELIDYKINDYKEIKLPVSKNYIKLKTKRR